MQAIGADALSVGQTGVGNVRTNRMGVYGGVDYVVAGLRIGINDGYFHDKVRDRNVAQRAEIATGLIDGAVSYDELGGGLTATVGVIHGWHRRHHPRRQHGRADRHPPVHSMLQTTQAFGEVAYVLVRRPGALTPFLAAAVAWERSPALAESGGTLALTVACDSRRVTIGEAGVRASASYALAPP